MTASQAEMEMALMDARAGMLLASSQLLLALAEAYMDHYGPRLNAPRLTPGPVAVPQTVTGLFIHPLLTSPIKGEV